MLVRAQELLPCNCGAASCRENVNWESDGEDEPGSEGAADEDE
jgi:hypothetical protein